MGSPKELLRGPLVGFWAWILCGIAMGAALPTPNPAIDDDYSTPNYPSTVVYDDYIGPTLPTTTEEDLDFPAETPSPSETNGETPEAVGEGEMSSSGEPPKSGLASSDDDSGPLTSTPKTFRIPEDLKENPEVPSVDKNVLSQVNSSDPTLGKEILQGDPPVESQEAPKETPSPDLEVGHEATELIAESYPGITDAPVTVLATLEEDLLASPSGKETEISREIPPEGDNLLENIPGDPNLDEELKPNPTSWEATEAVPLEAEKDSPEPSMDEGGMLEDPSSNPTVLPSIPEDLPDQETGENVDDGDQPSLSSDDSAGMSQSSTGFPPIWPSPTHEKFGSPGTNEFDVGSLQPSPTSVDSPEERGDTAPIPSSSGPELNHESPVNLPSEEPEDLVDPEVSNSSSSDRTMDAPSDSGPPGDTLVRTSQLNASDIPRMGLSVTPEMPSQLPEDDELGPTSTVKEEEDLGNPKSNEGTSLVSPLPGQESEIPDEKRSGDLLNSTDSSLNPGEETANLELEDSEATTTSNSVPENEINFTSSDSATVSENESGALFDKTVSSPPPVDHEGTDKAQEPLAETQGSPAEVSAPASTDGPSSEKEGSEVTSSGSSGNIGSSLETIPSASDKVDTEANSEDGSGSDLSSDTELSPSSGTPPPMGRSGTLSDQLSPNQSLVENALTSGSSEGEPTFPSTSPNEALSGPLISEPDTTELPSNLLPGSQPQLPKENDIETGSGDVEDSPPPSVDNEGAAKDQGPSAEASAPGSTNEPSSEREGSEVLPSGSPGNMGLSSENSEDHSVSDLPPSETELSSISGTPLSTSSQPPKEDDMETHSEVPEDSVSINGEETSSAPSIINPQSDPAEVTEESNISGDLSDGPTISPKEERIGSTLESRVKEEPLLDGDNTQDKINTPSEQQQDSEDALETSIPSSGDEPAVKSGTTSPLVDNETSTKELSGKTSSASIEVMLPNSENEDGEPSPRPSSKTLDSSPSNESRDGEDGTESASSAKTAITVSNDGQLESDFPVGQSVTSPVGGILALAPIEDGETSVSRDDDAQLSKGAVSSADATPQPSSSAEGTETSASEPSTVGSQPSPARIDGELSLNKDGTETALVESSNNGGSQLPPDGDQPSTTTGASEISEGPSSVNGKEGSLIPSAAESSSKEVENVNSESGTHPESQPSLDVSPTTEVQDSENEQAVEEDISNNGEKLSLTSSATASQSPGISDDEVDVSGDSGNGESSPHEELEMTGSGSTNNGGAQPSVVAGGATETSDVSDKVEPLESSSSADEGETSLGSSAGESSTGPEDQEVSGKPSNGDGMEAVNSKPATKAEPQSSPNDGPSASKEAGVAEVSGTSEDSIPASAPESQAISSSNEGETSKTATNAGSQLSLGGESAAGTPPLDGAEISGASSSVPGEKGSLSPSTPESPGDPTSTKELGTASRNSTSDEASQLSADGTSPEDSLPSEGAEEPTESPPPSTPEEKDEAVNSLLAVHKGILTASSADGVQPSLLGTKGSPAKISKLVSGKPGPQEKANTLLLSSKPEVLANTSKLVSGKLGLQTKPGAPQLSSKPEVLANTSKLVSGKLGLQTKPGAPQLSSKPEVPANTSKLVSGKLGLQTKPGAPQLSSKPEVPAKASKLASGKPGLEGKADAPQLSSETEVPVETPQLSSGKPGLQGEADAPQLNSKTEVPVETPQLSSAKPELQGEGDAPQLSSKTELPVETPQLSSAKPELQGEADAPQLSSKTELPVETPQLSSAKPELQGEADVPQLSSKTEVPVETPQLSSAKPGLQGEADAPQLFSETEVPVETPQLSSAKPGLQGEADAPQLSSKTEVPVETPQLSSAKPGLQGEADAPQLSSKTEVPVETPQLSSAKPGLQGEANAPQLSSKTKVPVETPQLSSAKPGLQGEADAPQLSSKTKVPVETPQLSSAKPGLQGEADAPQLSSKTKIPVETPQLSSAKPGLQGEADVPQLNSKTEVPVETPQLSSGKPGLQGEADVPQLSSKTEVPVETPQLSSGKPGLQTKPGAPQLSSKPEVPAKGSKLASGKPGLQLKADTGLQSFNSDVLANSEHTFPGKASSASSESTSSSNEKDKDSSSDSSEEHQTFMKGKVALDLSNAKPGRSKPGVHLALTGVGLLAAKSSEPTGKAAKRRSDSKKSKDKKAKPDEKSAIIHGAPSDEAVSLYPYGASVNDKQYVERKVDFNSPLFKPEIGIPLGKSLRNSLYFTDNGQIVFPASDKDISSYPNPPSGGFNGREEVPMVAVFWDNADFSKGSGTIFYQEYPCGNSAKHPLVQDVEAKIRRYVNSSYRARWLLKVTWAKVQRYPAQKQTSKTNTYQAILTTDGYRTYALFLYQEGGMQWDFTKLSAPNMLIGYTSGDGYFRNDPLMTGTPAEKYRPDAFRGYSTDVRGLWIYKLDSWIRVNYRQRCLDWLGHERLPSSWNRGLPPCPCSLKQGMTDNRYTTSQKGWQNTDSTLLYSSSPNNYGAGVRCLYNGNGQLQEGRQERIWRNSRKNYPNNDEELKLHDWCCHKAGNPQMCEKYGQKRPRIGCQGYKPPIWG